MKQTIKVEIQVYVGSDKHLLNTYYVWDPEEDDMSADETAQALLEHLKTKMSAALEPCFFDHVITNEKEEA